MNTHTFSRTSIALALIAVAFLSRFMFLDSSWANFSPIGAIALFSGATISDKKWAFAIPVLGLWLSNMILNNVFYSQFYTNFSWGFEATVFVAFAGMVIVGMLGNKKVSATHVIWTALGGTLVFFVLSNLGVWAEGILYPRTLTGLSACFINALPFLKNSLLSNLAFSTVLFGAYAMLGKRVQVAK